RGGRRLTLLHLDRPLLRRRTRPTGGELQAPIEPGAQAHLWGVRRRECEVSPCALSDREALVVVVDGRKEQRIVTRGPPLLLNLDVHVPRHVPQLEELARLNELPKRAVVFTVLGRSRVPGVEPVRDDGSADAEAALGVAQEDAVA